MVARSLSERVAALEHQVAELEKAVKNGSRPRDWRDTIGMFAGDEIMKQIDEEARKIREADRRRARRLQTKSRRAHS
jgi:hypothetical protein